MTKDDLSYEQAVEYLRQREGRSLVAERFDAGSGPLRSEGVLDRVLPSGDDYTVALAPRKDHPEEGLPVRLQRETFERAWMPSHPEQIAMIQRADPEEGQRSRRLWILTFTFAPAGEEAREDGRQA
jgi:hypothetical protein